MMEDLTPPSTEGKPMKHVINFPLPNSLDQPLFRDWATSQDSLNKEMAALMRDVVATQREVVAMQREQSKQIAELFDAIKHQP